jgi:PPOX class probable F420-dependent enzyme
MAELNNPQVQKILHSKAFAHLATNGSNGEPQSSPMWFLWDGEYIKFTHATNRKKYQNIKRDPRVSVSITDVDVPYNYAEFRGVVERTEDDPNGIFFNTLAKRYGLPVRNPGDPRVILYVKIQHIVGQNLNMGGYVFAQVYRVLPHRILVNFVKRLFRPKAATPPMQEESISRV